MVDKDSYITCDLNEVIVHKQLIVEDRIRSSNNSFKLYTESGESYLEIDNIIERNREPIAEVTHSELLSLIENKKLIPK